MLSTIRKAVAAALTAFLAALATAYAAHGWPGWTALGGMAIFAALAGLATWAVPNARPVPDTVARLRAQAAARTQNRNIQ